MRNPATALFGDFERFVIGKTNHIVVTFLFNETTEIYGSAVNTNRRTCLQSFGLKAHFLELLGDAITRHLPHSSAWKMLLTDMNQAIQESAIGQNDSL